jgi:hypothetical protein
MWSQQKYPEKKLKFGDHVLWNSQKDKKHILQNVLKICLVRTKYNSTY